MRAEEYRRPDGTWSRSRHDAILAAPGIITAAVHAVGTLIPVAYFLGTSQHESNRALNERDTEESGFQSWGIYQISQAEATSVGCIGADLLHLDEATEVMVRLAERHAMAIRAAAGLPPDAVSADLCSYLAIAHNEGVVAATRSIRHHGLDWAAYKRRNPTLRIVAGGYGDHVRPAA